MSPEEIKKLLGGYATGTLTAEEQQALFAAALEDQELFDAMAREQTLRDLLSDPASRAELLSALDTPAKGRFAFWEWLRRPVVAGLAVAGIGGIAVVAVWQGTRVPASKPAPQIMAQLRMEPAPIHSSAEIPPPAKKAGKSVIAPTILPPPRFAADNSPAPVAVPPAAPPPAAIRAPAAPKEELAAAAEEKAAKRAEAVPAVVARKTDAQPAVASGQVAGMSAGAIQDAVTVDARALFYANPVTPAANAFVPAGGSGGGGAAPPVRPSPQADTATRMKAVSGMAASTAVAAPRLGVRISILRGTGEADLTTVLDPGETVRLKVIPNADGFLYVMDGTRLVANGAAQRLRPFETPELRFEGSGQKRLSVTFSRRPQNVNAQSTGSLTHGNVVQASAEQERATYAVSGEAVAQQIIVPVTLTYR